MRWLYRPSLVVAIAMMLAVPFATLQMPDIVAECCCPSPEVCKCPDHKGERTDDTSMRSCHRTSHHLSITKLSTFAPARGAVRIAPPVAALVATTFIPQPHPAPPARRPDAPS